MFFNQSSEKKSKLKSIGQNSISWYFFKIRTYYCKHLLNIWSGFFSGEGHLCFVLKPLIPILIVTVDILNDAVNVVEGR